MAWVEIILLIIGIGAFVASFLIPASGEQLSKEDRKRTDEEIKAHVDKYMDVAASQMNQSVDDAVQYALEKTERSLERLSNETIMGISEYADTVMSDIHKNHEEVVFLYDMLNDKQTALKNTVTEIEKNAKAASVLAQEAKDAADKAAQNANEAVMSADEAAKNAADAADGADEASQIVQEALQNANEAVFGANEAAQKADMALKTAGEAALRADAATQTAGAASQVANEAILSADRARQRAGDAMKSAKEVQKIKGTAQKENPQPDKADVESQNLSGLARVQGIQEAEQALMEQEEAERALEEQMEIEQALAAQVKTERAVTEQALTVQTKAEQDAEISVMDISQKAAKSEESHFKPFVVPRVTIIGEPADDAWEKEQPRTSRTRSSSGSRRSTTQKSSASDSRSRAENGTMKEDNALSRENVMEERNNNERILAMHREGKSNIAIAKELGIGVGEVKLVIDLFRR